MTVLITGPGRAGITFLLMALHEAGLEIGPAPEGTAQPQGEV
jgi:hypothetical protein